MSDRLSIIDTLNNDGKFSTFVRMLKTSKAADLISGAGPFTVFAPTNDAFGKVPDPQMNGWLSQTDQTNLAKVLAHHIVPGKLFASNISGKGPTATLSGAELTFTDTNGLKVSGSGVLGRNIEATNGIIHAVDTVLVPSATTMAASATVANASPMTPAAVEQQADGHSDAGDAQPMPTNMTPAAAPQPAASKSVLS